MMMMMMNKKRNAGMTLIETIVAFAIISIIIVVAMLSINTITSINVKAQNMNVADQEMEYMIASDAEPADKNDTQLTFLVSDNNGNPLKIPDTDKQITVVIPGSILTYEVNGKALDVFRPEPEAE